MTRTRLLYLSSHQMSAYSGQPGKLVCEGSFATNEDGHREFSAYLARHTRCVFSILVNVSEEGFQIETIPYLKGADRQAVLSRKIGQYFFTAALTASLSLGFQKTQRKDERVMLAALTSNDFFAPWLNAISYAGVALSGIYSLPLLAPSLLKKLRIDDEQCLLLTVQDQSIRQSYFEKGELIFSRLTPLQNSSIGGIAQTFSTETLKLQQYLASQRLIGRSQSITAYILAHSNAFKAIEASCLDSATTHYHVLRIEDVARRVGLRAAPTDTHCEQLFLNLLLTSPQSVQFANDDLRHDFHLRQIRSGLLALGGLALLGGLLFAGSSLLEVQRLRQESEALHSEAELSRLRYAEIVKTFPAIPTDNETLRRLIDRYVEQEKASASPTGLYAEISRALQSAPAVEIEGIDWSVGDDQTASGANARAASSNPVDKDHESAIVRGKLKLAANANARQMLAAFNLLVEALKTNPELQVDILQRPFDIEPGKALKGGDTLPDENRPRGFVVQITRRIES